MTKPNMNREVVVPPDFGGSPRPAEWSHGFTSFHHAVYINPFGVHLGVEWTAGWLRAWSDTYTRAWKAGDPRAMHKILWLKQAHGRFNPEL